MLFAAFVIHPQRRGSSARRPFVCNLGIPLKGDMIFSALSKVWYNQGVFDLLGQWTCGFAR